MNATLGPLELVDGRCVVGDVRRPGGCWVEFREEGLYRHVPAAAEGELIPWNRVMLGLRVIIGRGYPSKGGNYSLRGLLGGLPGFRGRGVGHLDMTLRHPYEDWSVEFGRHHRSYRFTEVLLLDELLKQTVAAGEAHRLADAAWLGDVVARLKPLTAWSNGGIRNAVAGARQAGEPTEA
ncbi:hypothetical protein ABZV77_14025 [Streptomyces sp. NPDC004732]|uniref:hypothetical protein n=1 Tax=Streptomyces sp. NPDC004732 TaxID=3154290 RepID=UPI0033A34B65